MPSVTCLVVALHAVILAFVLPSQGAHQQAQRFPCRVRAGVECMNVCGGGVAYVRVAEGVLLVRCGRACGYCVRLCDFVWVLATMEAWPSQQTQKLLSIGLARTVYIYYYYIYIYIYICTVYDRIFGVSLPKTPYIHRTCP